MSDVGSLAALTAVAVAGLILLASACLQPAPSLDRVIAHLRRGADGTGYHPTGDSAAPRRLISPALSLAERHPSLTPSRAQLTLLDRTVDQHVALLAIASLFGLVIPATLIGAAQAVGLVGLWWFAPAVVALAGAVVAPILVHSSAVDRANAIRSDLRYQVSAFLDVVTMLLAGNTGYEGALEQAAVSGDGRLFAELRRRMREAGARGTSLTAALESAGVDLGLEELERIAAAAALSAAEGAPVARTLAAKCATLRASLATEQETEARLRTSRLTTPIVGMSLIFMAMVIYPALNVAT